MALLIKKSSEDFFLFAQFRHHFLLCLRLWNFLNIFLLQSQPFFDVGV
uniref:Uncharacterized protein n=1 Tax=Anguilla anguilla TaxID=7936 RepID=A0A0E9XUZ5_ANGAN